MFILQYKVSTTQNLGRCFRFVCIYVFLCCYRYSENKDLYNPNRNPIILRLGCDNCPILTRQVDSLERAFHGACMKIFNTKSTKDAVWKSLFTEKYGSSNKQTETIDRPIYGTYVSIAWFLTILDYYTDYQRLSKESQFQCQCMEKFHIFGVYDAIKT